MHRLLACFDVCLWHCDTDIFRLRQLSVDQVLDHISQQWHKALQSELLLCLILFSLLRNRDCKTCRPLVMQAVPGSRGDFCLLEQPKLDRALTLRMGRCRFLPLVKLLPPLFSGTPNICRLLTVAMSCCGSLDSFCHCAYRGAMEFESAYPEEPASVLDTVCRCQFCVRHPNVTALGHTCFAVSIWSGCAAANVTSSRSCTEHGGHASRQHGADVRNLRTAPWYRL